MTEIETGPWVAVVIPARDAAATLAETLDSLLAQTDPRWEALVVDDDSGDDTLSIAEEYAARDRRFTVLSSRAHSEGGARNVGIRASRAPWLLFLDADDLIEPETLERVSNVLGDDPSVDGVAYGWLRFTPDGRIGARDHWHDAADPFAIAATHTPFPIHACVVRRSLVVDVGMFDESLRAAADWDLWQRVFRAGAKIVRMRGTFARYRSHGPAMSADPYAMFEASRIVLDRAYRPDPRVREPVPAYAAGRGPAHRRQALIMHICWWGGAAIASGLDAVAIVRSAAPDLAIGDVPPGPLPFEALALGLAESIRLRTLTPAKEWPALWTRYVDPIRAFFSALERSVGAPGSAWRAELLLGPSDGDVPRRQGDTQAVDIELTQPIAQVVLEPDVEHVVVIARIDGRAVGILESSREALAEGELREALADRWHWDLCRHHVERLGRVAEEADDDDVWAAMFDELWWRDGDAGDRPVRLGWRKPIEVVVGRPIPRIVVARRRRIAVVLRVGRVSLSVVRLAAADAGSVYRTALALTVAHGPALFRAVALEALIGSGPLEPSLRRALLLRASEAREIGPPASELSGGGRSPSREADGAA